MSKDNSTSTEDTQKTQPKKGEPVEIPIPKKSQIMRHFERIVTRRSSDDETDDSGAGNNG